MEPKPEKTAEDELFDSAPEHVKKLLAESRRLQREQQRREFKLRNETDSAKD